MALHDLSDDREPEPGAALRARAACGSVAGRAIEPLEDAGAILGRDAGTVVAHFEAEEAGPARRDSERHFNASARRHVLDLVLEQVLDHLLHPAPVGVYRGVFRGLSPVDLQTGGSEPRPEPAERVATEGRPIQRLSRQRRHAAFEPGEVQDVPNQVIHPPRLFEDPVQVARPLVFGSRHGGIEERLGVASDGRERGRQLVRHVGQEPAPLGVGLLDALPRFREPGRHAIQSFRDPADLVPRAVVDPRREIPGRDARGERLELSEPPNQNSNHEDSRHRGDDHGDRKEEERGRRTEPRDAQGRTSRAHDEHFPDPLGSAHHVAPRQHLEPPGELAAGHFVEWRLVRRHRRPVRIAIEAPGHRPATPADHERTSHHHPAVRRQIDGPAQRRTMLGPVAHEDLANRASVHGVRDCLDVPRDARRQFFRAGLRVLELEGPENRDGHEPLDERSDDDREQEHSGDHPEETSGTPGRGRGAHSLNRYPAPQTVWTYRGFDGSGSSFWRSRLTRLSIERSSTTRSEPQTCSINASRLKTRPGRDARK